MSISIAIRKYGYFIVIILVVVVCNISIYVLGNRIFEIKNIEVEGIGIKLIIDQKRIPKNLIFFPTDKLTEQILKDNPLVDQVTFKKKLPHTLVIYAKVRTPIARIETQSGQLAIDKNGIILGTISGSSNLPLLVLTLSKALIGERISEPAILASLLFLAETQSFLKVISIEATESASLLAKTSRTNILFPQDIKLSGRVTTLQTILTGFRIKGTLPTSIDLRFDKPIVKF